MVDPTSSAQPTPPPQGATPAPPTAQMKSSSAANGVSAGFAAMLGPTATPEQVQKAMMQCVNFIITQLKEDEKKAKETAKHMRDVIEDKDQ